MKISNFQFDSPYLEESFFKKNPNFDYETNDLGFNMKNQVDLEIKKNPTENEAYVALVLKINEENPNAPFQIKLKASSKFYWENLSGDKLQRMLKSNAPSFLLSYMRPIVMSMTTLAGLPAYYLPFINFNDK